jgi:hypothetical protein
MYEYYYVTKRKTGICGGQKPTQMHKKQPQWQICGGNFSHGKNTVANVCGGLFPPEKTLFKIKKSFACGP